MPSGSWEPLPNSAWPQAMGPCLGFFCSPTPESGWPMGLKFLQQHRLQTDSSKPRPGSPRPQSEKPDEACAESPLEAHILPCGPEWELWLRERTRGNYADLKHNHKRWSFLGKWGADMPIRLLGALTTTSHRGACSILQGASASSISRASVKILTQGHPKASVF